MLKSRIITGIILALIFLSGLFLLPFIGFTLFIAVVSLIGAWEWSNLASFEKINQRAIYCFLTGLWMALIAYYVGLFTTLVDTDVVRYVFLVACAWWALALLWIQGYPSSAILWQTNWVRAMMGWLILVPTWLALSYLHRAENGVWFILLVMATVIAADTGAYFFGKAFGRKKLAVNVSPGKSWEGFWGGLFCSALLAVLVAFLVDTFSVQALLPVIVLTSVTSVIGDLLESMIKRHRGVKDSGSILPGHGGMMDRLDSITAAAPVFTMGAMLSGWLL